MSIYEKSQAKSNFRIIAGNRAPTERQVHAGGVPPPANMPPAEYLAICEGAKLATLYGKPTAVVSFRIAEGQFFGVSLRGYFEIDLNGETTAAGCRYNQLCEIALARPIEPGDDLHPSRVFPGKIFKILARYRAASSGKKRESQDYTVKKDPSDTLRVGTIIELVEGGL
jgi:hypothetical protein